MRPWDRVLQRSAPGLRHAELTSSRLSFLSSAGSLYNPILKMGWFLGLGKQPASRAWWQEQELWNQTNVGSNPSSGICTNYTVRRVP